MVLNRWRKLCPSCFDIEAEKAGVRYSFVDERRKCGWAEIFPIVDAHVHSEVCPMFFRLGTGETLQRAFAAAGFSGITSKRLETRLYADAGEACEAAFVGGPVALAYSGDCVMKKLIVAATLVAFGAGVVLPAAPIIGSSGAFAAQKSAAKAKKKSRTKAPAKGEGWLHNVTRPPGR